MRKGSNDFIIYAGVAVILLMVLSNVCRPSYQDLLDTKPTTDNGYVNNLAPMPTRTPRPTAINYDDRGHGGYYITDDGRLLFHYNPKYDKYAKTKATPTPTPVPISIEKLTADITVGHEVNGSDTFKSRISDAIYDLSKHGATLELIRRAGHFTINEDPSPCDETWTAGCALLGSRKIEIKNHQDSKYMNIVLIHEIAHLALGPSECDAVNAEIAYLRSDIQYENYHLRGAIEERLGRVC